MPGGLAPEQQARVEIDRKLEAAGWVVQDFREMELSGGRGVAIREFPTATGPADYLLYGDRKALGSIGQEGWDAAQADWSRSGICLISPKRIARTQPWEELIAR
jgi:hypothetical protein